MTMRLVPPPCRGGRHTGVLVLSAALLLAGCAGQAETPPVQAAAMVAASPANQIVAAHERGSVALVHDGAGASWQASIVSFFDAASRRDCALVLLEKPENQREQHERVICREASGWQFAKALKQRPGGPVF